MRTFFKHKNIILLLFIFIGGFFRLYNLNWGAPFYFHPDERNIASAITQLQFPAQMNPHFFAYGSLPIYLVYFSNLFINFLTTCRFTFSNCPVIFDQAIVGLRLLSSILSILLIPLMYLIGKKMKDKILGIWLALLTTTSVGFIQYSHFGTYETVITFFTALLFFACLKLWQKTNKQNIFFCALVSGMLVSCKVTNIVLLVIPVIILLINFFKYWKFEKKMFRQFIFLFLSTLAFFSIVSVVSFLTNPYTFFDYNSFVGSMRYESGVALNTEPVFYTGEFYNTSPILFQMQHDFPFLITPFLLFLFLPALAYIFFRSILKFCNANFILCLIFLFLTLIPQAFFFVKWTRYMVPVLPFIYIILGITLLDFWNWFVKKRQAFSIQYLVFGIFILINFVYAMSFVITVYVEPDSRIAAAQYAHQHIAGDSPILSEVYDMGLVAFNQTFSNIKMFNFYDLEYNTPESNQFTLQQALKNSDYIILPSQRLLKVRLLNAKKFPAGNEFYKQLFSGENGFQKIYETPCDIWCLITYSGSPVYSYEETANVFDRPEVYIFKKKQ
ncbi:MAG TPA: glycosyltransferase family 39 protein [Patescibacteria group bacterium]|nr:glycosyltransferase family 39 protein [Patescibacteria group bacterium]